MTANDIYRDLDQMSADAQAQANIAAAESARVAAARAAEQAQRIREQMAKGK